MAPWMPGSSRCGVRGRPLNTLSPGEHRLNGNQVGSERNVSPLITKRLSEQQTANLL